MIEFLKNDWVIGIALSLIQILFNKLLSIFEKRSKTKDPRTSTLIFFILCFVWISCISVNGYFFYYTKSRFFPLLFFVILSTIFCYTIWRFLNQFWSIGIIGSDTHTIEGINYENSLKLCRSQLTFHGIGASKLTTCQEFEKALARCKQGKPIRFLLLNPEDVTLVTAAKRAQQNSNSYHERVLKSLRTLKELKEEREFDIQVKFYSGKPIFRLMFVDDTLCLFSGYTQLGVDDGSRLPQVHLRNSSDYNHTNSLYGSFEHYFEELWIKSQEWDFIQYLNGK